MNRWSRLAVSSSFRRSHRFGQCQLSVRFPIKVPSITYDVRSFVSTPAFYEGEQSIHKEEVSQIHEEEDPNVVEDRMLMKDFFTGLGNCHRMML